jgi:hypothetical protein
MSGLFDSGVPEGLLSLLGVMVRMLFASMQRQGHQCRARSLSD